MSDYYRAHKGDYPATVVRHRAELIELLMDGLSAKEAFDRVKARIR